MPTEREERVVLNEALFRAANERAAAWEERQDRPGDAELYHCECADLDCREKVLIPASEYERVRSESSLFFVIPGHEIPDVETVIETNEHWAVIRKDPEVRRLAEETEKRPR